MNHSLPIIAIVGEPNVGKSTLMNKIAGGQTAVTSPVPGTTRDRQYVDTAWNGVEFTLVDMAGITFGATAELELALNRQIEVALQEADLLLFVVDGKQPPAGIDRKTVLKFRKSKKPVVLAVNKVDSPKHFEEQTIPYQALGIKPLFPVSAINSRGLGDLLDYLAEFIKTHDLYQPVPEKVFGIGVSIVGKPNVGKSSIFNHLIKEERVVVSAVPGTTRAPIDTAATINSIDYTFIDTAGLKRKEHRQALPDLYSGFHTFKAIRRSDVSLFIIDASEPLAKQDQHIAAEIFQLNKGVIILANKYDLYQEGEQALRDYVSAHFPQLWFSPLFFVSAKTGQGLEEALAAIKPIYDNRHKEVPQERIDQIFATTLRQNPPRLMRDQRQPKVYGLKQVATNPPLFELTVNFPGAISQEYRRYLQKAIIKNLDFWGTPVGLKIKSKDKK